MTLCCNDKFSALLTEKPSKHYAYFYGLNCLHSCRAKKKVNLKKLCGNKGFYNVLMLSENTKMLEFNHYQKPKKTSFIIDTDKIKCKCKIILKKYVNIYH